MSELKDKKKCITSSAIVRFLNKNCKPLMMWYYRNYKKEDILKCLTIFHDYKDIESGIDMYLVISILSSEDGWDLDRATKAFGYCSYCGYIA